MSRLPPGERPQQVLKLLREHGLLTSEQLRAYTGMQPDHLGHVVADLIRDGLIERPVRATYRLTH